MDQRLEHAFRFKRPDPHSIHPTLFIGLGGAGGAMVERVQAKLETRWDRDKFRGLYHAVALDTDIAGLERYRGIPEENRVLLSDFDKRWYAASKRGDSYLDADPAFTQWAHAWYGFRSQSGAGAGQIRLESRLSLHYQLESDRAGLIARLQGIIREALHHDNMYRCTSPPYFNVHIFCSIAGGTGSGAFLSMAYLLRRLIAEAGHESRTYGYLVLPGPFFPAVPKTQHVEIDANGYAGLKELEHLMGLGLERADASKSEVFHYSGFHRSNTTVEVAPFNFVYLLDAPRGSSASDLTEYCDAVSDAMFVQFFSPVISVQNSQLDNSVKLVSGGSANGYVLNYGTYGANVLILPARDIVEYCAHRYALDAIDRLMLQRSSGLEGAVADHAVRTDTPEWQQFTPAQRAERLDNAFIAFVNHLATSECESNPEGGMFEAVRQGRSPVTGQPLVEAFDTLVRGVLDKLEVQISLERATRYVFHERDHDANVPVQRLAHQVTQTRLQVDAAWATARVVLTNGQLLRRFFDEHQVPLHGQRHLLIGLIRKLRERLGWLSSEVAKRRQNAALDSGDIVRELETHQERLKATAPQTLIERFKRSNDDFEDARGAFLSWFNGTLVQGWQELLKLECEQRVTEAFVQRIESLLQVFRDLIDQTLDARARLEHLCAHILRHGGLVASGSESNLYAFDTEALRDDAAGRRLWGEFYDSEFAANAALFSAEEILPTINRAFDPVRDEHGALRQPDVGTIAARVVDGLVGAGREKLGPTILGTDPLSNDRSKSGLALDDALELEARIALKLGKGVLGAADAKAADEYVQAKLAHAVRKSDVLCTLRAPAVDDSIAAESFTMASMHPNYENSLGARLKSAHDCKINSGWDDPRTLILYSATLGIPLFWLSSVNGRMKEAYRAVQRDKVLTRRYPLHIDSNWEHALEDLDPLERERARETARLDETHIRFAFGRVAGVVVKEDKAWRLDLDGFERVLGASLPAAIEAMEEMRGDLAKRLDAPMASLRAELESPHEPASAWEPVLGYLNGVSSECLSLPVGNLMHRHHEVVSEYVRHYAPVEVRAVAEPYLAAAEA